MFDFPVKLKTIILNKKIINPIKTEINKTLKKFSFLLNLLEKPITTKLIATKKNGLNICIFPEGGIPESTTFLRNFKNGSFRLALENKIKIVPLTLINNKSHFPQEYYKGYPGLVKITVHKPVSPNSFSGEGGIKKLNNYIYNIIFNELKKHES